MDLLVTSSCHRPLTLGCYRHQLLLMVPWLPTSSPTTCYKGRSFRHKGILTFFHTAVSVWESSKTYHKFTNLLYSVWQLMAVTVLNVLGKVTVISWSPLKPLEALQFSEKAMRMPPFPYPKDFLSEAQEISFLWIRDNRSGKTGTASSIWCSNVVWTPTCCCTKSTKGSSKAAETRRWRQENSVLLLWSVLATFKPFLPHPLKWMLKY